MIFTEIICFFSTFKSSGSAVFLQPARNERAFPSGGIHDHTAKKYKSTRLSLEMDLTSTGGIHHPVLPSSACVSAEHHLRTADPGYPDGYRQFHISKKGAAGRSECPGQSEHVQGGRDTDADHGYQSGVLQSPGQRRRQSDRRGSVHRRQGTV